jgi:uncharacterized damage-inducible protein DinB
MKALIESLALEFREEMPPTRRVLERIPADKLSWKPHGKSRSLGELAMHVANIPGMAERIITSDEFAVGAAPMATPESAEQILSVFDKNARAGDSLISNLTEEKAMGEWRLVFKGKEIFRKKRSAALRTNVLNHLYHHRGQLSVYLRLLEVPVPSVYGPTADENPFA